MSGESEVITPVEPTDPDALTVAEQEYFNSGGEKTDGLSVEAKADPEKVVEPVKDKTADGAAKPEVKAGEGDKAATEPSDDDDDEPEHQPKDGRQRTVSYKKFERTRKKLDEQLAAERSGREATAKELTELRERFTRGDERLKLLTEALAPPAADTAQADPRPDPEQDIFAYVKWQDRQLEKLNAQVSETRETFQERNQADTLKNEYQADAVSFARETPDFGAAYVHLLNTRGAMLESQGYSQEEASTIVRNEEKQLVERAKATGKRPAAMVYALAQQLGYRKADPAKVDPPPAVVDLAVANGGVAAAANGNGNGAAPSVSEEIARIAAGQAAGKSLSGAGGGASEISLESLGAMSDAEFEAFYAKNGSKVDAVLGKRH